MRKYVILIVVFVFATTVGGCIKDNESYKYSGIEKKDISGLSDDTNFEFIYVYKGSTENWAATCYVFRRKGTDIHRTRLLLKFLGEKPQPAGQLSYSYRLETSSGSGTLPAESKNRIYKLGESGSNGLIPKLDSVVSFNVDWNGKSESFELKSDQ